MTLIKLKKNRPQLKHLNPLQKSEQSKRLDQSTSKPLRKNQNQNRNRLSEKFMIKMKSRKHSRTCSRNRPSLLTTCLPRKDVNRAKNKPPHKVSHRAKNM